MRIIPTALARPGWGVGLALASMFVQLAGCCHPSVTAVSLSHPGEPEGIPFYLPKPLLIIAKNFRNIQEPTVGLTDTAPIPNFFDDQARYGELHARTNFIQPEQESSASVQQTFPGVDGKNLASQGTQRLRSGQAEITPTYTAPNDGLSPETFYTYQIIFVPDLTQKYGLRIKGGVGEIRAAMNLVNGWQFTGIGPYYMKDSSTAQNILSSGVAANLTLGGVGDVVKNLTDLRKAAVAGGNSPKASMAEEDLANLLKSVSALEVDNTMEKVPCQLLNYAEIYVYEPFLDDHCMMQWRLVADHAFNRDYFKSGGKTMLRFGQGEPQPTNRKQIQALEDQIDQKRAELIKAPDEATKKALEMEIRKIEAELKKLRGAQPMGSISPGNLPLASRLGTPAVNPAPTNANIPLAGFLNSADEDPAHRAILEKTLGVAIPVAGGPNLQRAAAVGGGTPTNAMGNVTVNVANRTGFLDKVKGACCDWGTFHKKKRGTYESNVVSGAVVGPPEAFQAAPPVGDGKMAAKPGAPGAVKPPPVPDNMSE